MKPTKIYAEHLEDTALEQFRSAMEQDFAIRGALMPDAHTGYSLPIGGVIATDGVIVPAWVGYDIGCGMCAIPMSTTTLAVQGMAKAIFDNIYRDVPTGFAHNQHPAEGVELPGEYTEVVKAQLDAGALRQIGSLGSGNHFIEIGADEGGTVWVILHSGSRNIGHKVCSHYMKVACGEDKPKEGHFGLRVDSDLGRGYLADMNFCLEFALANRREIIRRVSAIVSRYAGGAADWDRLINRNHNHATLRDGLWIHRKGATHAEAGMMGVIPGNMRDGSFIVRGKGNPDALWSSSHGAGRVMGRKQAERELSLSDFQETMSGITAKVGQSTLDEAPLAYKSIFDVMEQQSDLVEVVAHVRPIINIKA